MALQCGCAEMIQSTLVKRIVAHIKFDNAASLRAFEKAGFVRQGKEIVRGCDAVCMIMDLKGARNEQ
jgi:RimJ/RimL family protein N-acetyltransferase